MNGRPGMPDEPAKRLTCSLQFTIVTIIYHEEKKEKPGAKISDAVLAFAVVYRYNHRWNRQALLKSVDRPIFKAGPQTLKSGGKAVFLCPEK